MKPPPLRDDCFAMPRGVDWTPVDQALAQLRAVLRPVVAQHDVPLHGAVGDVLAADVIAPADHPPFMNAAVDGYGFNHANLPTGEEIALPLVAGRSAAGQVYSGTVPMGHGVRILTGGAIPQGVDTVILQEDVNLDGDHIYFRAGLKRGANTRPKGEDITKGAVVLPKGRKLSAVDIGVLSSVGVARVRVFQRLRVGVLSTGDELVDSATPKQKGQIFDANRPMLLGALRQWGYDAVDLGIQADDRGVIRQALNHAAQQVDVILTSGGASAGDEDHISKLLGDEGNLQNWRIAIKPGRPLALALWRGVPVFGLPGNPVAAMVCAALFAWPAFCALSGQGWRQPQSYFAPAAFSKNKKDGRREYLRARLNDAGDVEVFASEGSGRISGLSWADGLIELGHGAENIQRGDLVKFIPFGSLST
ncbi:molybdopterin molybdenumtransferase MoeA [Amylibacter marinus]|uniref:Molybdopterin molybdenumtransferase n=1 Tax=Amylibacter marinus TaxID=1475483 RepID=A0ABQ5VWR1_9RHOB|nr:gephyrin-like molybdotransferase Glp [Amylibacter marinus]GLQ35862.1 molybdopterin molybdenumtransferase MoeA [Amylibacter marinus]